MTTNAATLITPQTIRELSPSLMQFARRTAPRREDAEDLLQDTWISAMRSAPTFEGRSSLRSWLMGIMRREAIDRRRRMRDAIAFDEEMHAEVSAPLADQLHVKNTAARTLLKLAHLSYLERTAVRLCDIEDCDREEAAERMRITRGHLRVVLHRGRSRLERALTKGQPRGEV